ncbi:hypothetical protein M0804_014467 [Polistes exclamans]|nr:hypothetical protein M0804_014467 [Polistes exclamans]
MHFRLWAFNSAEPLRDLDNTTNNTLVSLDDSNTIKMLELYLNIDINSPDLVLSFLNSNQNRTKSFDIVCYNNKLSFVHKTQTQESSTLSRATKAPAKPMKPLSIVSIAANLTEKEKSASAEFMKKATKSRQGPTKKAKYYHPLYLSHKTDKNKNMNDRICPDGIRLFFDNHSVVKYDNKVLISAVDKVISEATDVYINCHDAEQQTSMSQKCH